MFQRRLNISKVVETKGCFLFGPRQTGKTTLLGNMFPHALFINLLQSETFRMLSAHPEKLRDLVASHSTGQKGSTYPLIVIDEIQKLPFLLDEVHLLIEGNKKLRFILTGSSARKLRRSGVNLLAGRLRKLLLHPITYSEFLSEKDGRDPVATMAQWGGMPYILTSKTPREDLEDYVGTYLKEEIQAEALVRSIECFSRFLNVAALVNAEQVIFSNVASDAEVPARTVREFFTILEDTLVGTLCPAYRKTKKRKAMGCAKFYFFDVGLANALLGRWELRIGTPEFGKALEHLVWRELTSYLSYTRSEFELFYWRSLSKFEVDFILQERHSRDPKFAVEVKAKRVVGSKDMRGLEAFSEEYHYIRKILVCLESACRRTESGIEIWPVEEFFKALWGGKLVATQ